MMLLCHSIKRSIKEGPNQIKATINGINSVEIKCFIQDGEAISTNAYISKFNRIYGNFCRYYESLK